MQPEKSQQIQTLLMYAREREREKEISLDSFSCGCFIILLAIPALVGLLHFVQ